MPKQAWPMLWWSAGSLLAASCDSGGAPGASPSRIVRGDTTFVTWPSELQVPETRVDSIRTLWRDERLEDPGSMVRIGDRIAVGDRERIHILRADGAHLGTYGRAGRGPEELGQVAAVAEYEGDVAVLDARNQRIALIDTSGAFVGTEPLARPLPFVNPRGGWRTPRAWDGGLLALYGENVRTDRPSRVALVWQGLGADDAHVVRTWDDVLWIDAGIMVPASAFPARALVAIGAEGRIAFGDGLDFCLSIAHVARPSVLEVCYAAPRARITDGVRGRRVSDVNVPAGLEERLAAAIARQSIGEHFPSYDRLLFGTGGLLWVRTLGADAPDVHPLLVGWRSEARPPYRRWVAIAPDGLPVRAVSLPTSFDPRIFEDRGAVGFLELASGEIVVAEARWSEG